MSRDGGERPAARSCFTICTSGNIMLSRQRKMETKKFLRPSRQDYGYSRQSYALSHSERIAIAATFLLKF